MTKEEVVHLFVLIEMVYPYCVPKSETVTHWFDHCRDLDFGKVIANLKRHMKRSPYPPAYIELTEFSPGTGTENCIGSWMEEYKPRKGA
ncbi:hypothetical protein J7E71_04020 [Mesobacillus foraminis]|uniref:hypothetical protein n=1 Tax=Mesobacillus foraminis TaxID=279826 RepID=UPI001BE6F27C|nr:hypothetical protein [Mesobacillus foraminis]MBT2755120.1 hypothetical protein [Mesobacillus foraminis]